MEMKTVLHLLSGPADALTESVINEQRAKGIPVEVIRLDEVTDWGAVVDRVLEAESICSW